MLTACTTNLYHRLCNRSIKEPPLLEGGTCVPVQIRKLTSDEAAKVFPKRGQMDLSEYTDALRELQPGDAAEIELGVLSSRALKRRLGQAAKQTGYSLKWARDGGTGVLRFQVREVKGTQTRPRNGRRGRRRRTE